MDHKDIISRLKRTTYKYSEADKIKKELRRLSYSDRLRIKRGLREETRNSDNSDIIDVVNDIIRDIENQQ